MIFTCISNFKFNSFLAQLHFSALTKDENGRADVSLEESDGNTEVLI